MIISRALKLLQHYACALLLILALPVIGHANTQCVKIDPTASHGTWDGWGISLCWWAKVYGDRDKVADLLFTTKDVRFAGEDLPGLGLNIARYNAGASSWNEVDSQKMVVSKIIKPYRQMEGYWLDGKSSNPYSKSWDWSVDVNQRAMLLKARDRGANRFELFSNSPMWWMCKNHNPSGAAKTTDENLPPENYDKFAVYLATIAKYAKNHWGLAFTTVEAFNEPTADFWSADCKQEGSHFSHKSMAAFLPILRTELDKRGLKATPISASDQTSCDEAVATWKSFSPETKALVNQVNVHGYKNTKWEAFRDSLGAMIARKDVREYKRGMLFNLVGKKRLWNSEYGDEDGTGLSMAQNLDLDFHSLHPTAWCYWQVFDVKGWGLVMTDMAKKKFQKVNPKYYVLAQYTRHIRPGMTILETGNADTVAAFAPKAHKLVIVARNGKKAGSMAFDLSGFKVADGMVTRWITEPKGTSRYQKLKDCEVAGNRIEVSLPADSIQTFEVENVAKL